MPQETNLNVAPYFDDYKKDGNYYKILFKPGYPVQARELTQTQSILQNQIERMGNHTFTEGSSVTGGGIKFTNSYTSIKIQTSNQGFNVKKYLVNLRGKTVVGSQSGLKLEIKGYMAERYPDNSYVVFVNYLNSGSDNNPRVISGESLLLEGDPFTTREGITFQPGEPVAQLVSGVCTFVGAAAVLSKGVYFARGYFIDVEEQTIILSPFINSVSTKIGIEVNEDIVNSDLDPSLADNAAGYSNYTAPGADRLLIELKLKAFPLSQSKIPNFIELMKVRNGVVVSSVNKTEYSQIGKEFARRTFDESGNYYVKPFSVTARNTLNDFEGNNGVFTELQSTYNNNQPKESVGTYKISPGKAYIEGYEVETIAPTFLDFGKTRKTKLLEDQSINYFTGPTFTLNNVLGSPQIGVGTDYTVSLRDARVGVASTNPAGNEIGLARVYDFALESGSYDSSNPKSNEWDIALYDIQTYTNITLNTPTTLSTPTHIKGKSSGATGYLRFGVSAGTAVTAYNTKGKFITGEQFIFNGVESGNIAASTIEYGTSDIKSIRGTVSTASTFNADVKQSPLFSIGEVNITEPPTSGASAGISTVTNTDPNKFFTGIATVGNIVQYTDPTSSTSIPSFARVESVSQSSLTISGVTTVSGICYGGLPSKVGGITPSNFKVLTSQFQSSTDNNLYTKLPKTNISDVDLTNSNIIIRKQFDVTITDGSTGAVSSGSADETFLPFDEERYLLIRTENGLTESLSADKINFNTGSTQITINGLGSNSAAKLIATLRKINVKEKIKERKKINTVTIINSKYSQSGIGTTTLNDGLTYSTVYGTRVQDDEISLGVPDATLIYAILESKNSSNPIYPKLSMISIDSATGKTDDLLIGEKFIGKDSNCKGIYVSKFDDSSINYIALNDYTLQKNEEVTFKESGIKATVSSTTLGSADITEEFEYDDGQRSTIYDFARITRKSGYKEPGKKITIVFESAFYSASDTGDITTVSSYDGFNYKNLPSINNSRVSDIIDIRPRVSDFSGTSYSPFEFLGRTFTGDGNSAKNILASDESILLDYSFYLPRLDKIFLSKTGTFQMIKGVPAETPEWPNSVDGALEVASIKLPPYIYNIEDVEISLARYKRYQMSDINRLEKRIESLEFYTSLSLLERDTLNMQITDSDGLNRFKSGFFVDDFSTTDNQLKKTIVKNAIDYTNGELRPSPYTTELDLKLDINSANGIRQTGRVLSLDYDHVVYTKQPFATRTESVTPFLINYYGGTIVLTPSSDIWMDQVVLEAKTQDLTTYTETSEQVAAGSFDNNTGYSPVIWDGWTTTWTGGGSGERLIDETSYDHYGNWVEGQGQRTRDKYRTITKTFQRGTNASSTQQRTGRRSIQRETFTTQNEGEKVINNDLVPYMRSRNLDFSAKGLKPTTSVFAFFDSENVNKFIIPKLLEISMVTGTFQVGETVIGTTSDGKELIRFRVAVANHKLGPYDNPGAVYNSNPYYQFTPIYRKGVLIDNILPENTTGSNDDNSVSSEVVDIPAEYSSTSNILNIDTLSLADKSENIYHGYVEKGLKLVGQSSSAQATVGDLHLKSDNLGSVRGSFFIPSPNDITTPKFEAGKKVFRLSSSPSNSQKATNVGTDASETFESTGRIETLQSTIISVRNILTHTQIQTETRTTGGGGGGSYSTTQTITIGSDNVNISITGGNSCPTPDMTILLSDGSVKSAGELQVGDEVDTLHETTLDRGNHKVTYVEIVQSDILELDFSGTTIKCSTTHKFYSNNGWIEAQDLVVGQKVSLLSGEVEFTGSTNLGQGDVVKIQIEDAHTYICEGFLSHNKTIVSGTGTGQETTTTTTTKKPFQVGKGGTDDGTLDDGTKVVDVIDDEEWKTAVAQKVTYVDVDQITEQEWIDAGRGEDGTPDVGAIVTETIVEVVDEETGTTTQETRLVVANEYGNETANTETQIEQQNLTVFTSYDDMNAAIAASQDTTVTLSDGSTVSGTGGELITNFNDTTESGTGRVVAFVAEADPVDQVYLDRLGRAPDGPGKNYWEESMRNDPKTAAAMAIIDSDDDVHKGTGTYASASAVIQEYLNNHFDAQEEVVAKEETEAAGEEWEGVNAFWEGKGHSSFDNQQVLCANKTDPLAQSFFSADSVGIFISRVDVYMATKDDTLPLMVQLRTVKMGLPTEEIIPFGEVVIDPENVLLSDNASVATPVVFPSPVYLPPGETYAVVLLSVSTNYSAWISRVGEVDIGTQNRPEAEQVTVSTQPTLGSLFKSQNGSTWNPSQWEDLKFTLYRANFNTPRGNINFTNPHLLTYSDDISPLVKDSLEIDSNKIRIGFNTTISDAGITLGNIVQQQGSNATGRYVGSAGTATGNLTITNPGVGYTPSSASETYNHVSMVTQTGNGRNGTLNMTITNGVAVAATVVNGGSGYQIGDVVGVATVGLTSLGRNIQFSIASLTGNNEFVLDNVQGEFATGVGKTIQYVTGAGVTILNYTAGGNVWLSGAPVAVNDGLHIRVTQKNHGMHSNQNTVTLTDIESDIQPTELAADYDSSSTGSIIVDDGTEFASFENVGVGSTNLGYIKVGSEILSYSGVTNNTLTGVTRGVDSTQTLSHSNGDFVHKYELDGVSLRRINTNHNTADATVANASGLDHYTLKVDMSSNGVDRSVGTSFPKLHFNDSKSTGGLNILSSENIPFEVVSPIIQNITPINTNLNAQIRTITGSSIDGSEVPYQDKGFEEISLTSNNYMSSPRMIASRINETTSLTTLPDNKSFTLNLSFETNSPLLSPIVDLDRVGMILTSNRLNNPISDYTTDERVKSLINDPHAFVYASQPVTLENGATSIKVHLEGHINVTSDIRAFYAIAEDENSEFIYQPFPGHTNLLATGQVIDPAKNNGLPDKLIPKTDVIAYTSKQVVWNDYEFSIDNLPTFRCFSIKLVGSGTNQAQPPRMKNLRVLALA